MPPRKPRFNIDRIVSQLLVGIFVATIACVLVIHFVVYEPPKERDAGKLVIDGPHCKVPDFDPTPAKLVITRRKLNDCQGMESLTTINSPIHLYVPSVIVLNTSLLPNYGVTTVDCCYHVVTRAKNSDSKIEISDECRTFENATVIDRNLEHIYVKCLSGGKIVYSNVHAIVNVKEKLKQRARQAGLKTEKAYKVMMIGLDSMSRINFKRMVQMRKAMQGNGWSEMKGYTRLSNTTFPNLFTVLTGQSPDEKVGNCDPTTNTFLDDCDFIWKDYQRAGYVTAFAEDQSDLNTFTMNHKGFKNQPTDYYLRPSVLAAEQNMTTTKLDDLVLCLGPNFYMDFAFVNALKIMKVHLRDTYFVLDYVNSLSHKQLSSSLRFDGKIFGGFVGELEEMNAPDMVLIYFGDTGTRFEHDPASFYEERAPFLFIKLPLRMQKEHPDFVINLRNNENRLTTPYDLHVTLRHILNLSAGNRVSKKAIGCRKCKSLLDAIPLERTCSDVNIPHDSCPCSLEVLSESKDSVKIAAEFAVNELNKKLAKMKTPDGERCLKFKLQNITSAKQQRTAPWHINYIIQFTVTPTKAIFEALLNKKFSSLLKPTAQFELMNEIIHINKGTEPDFCVSSAVSIEKRTEVDNEEYDEEKLFGSGDTLAIQI